MAVPRPPSLGHCFGFRVQGPRPPGPPWLRRDSWTLGLEGGSQPIFLIFRLSGLLGSRASQGPPSILQAFKGPKHRCSEKTSQHPFRPPQTSDGSFRSLRNPQRPQTPPGQAELCFCGRICLNLFFLHFAYSEANFDSSRFWPSALLGPEMVKFASNFCYCAVDLETGRFWPICPFGTRNGQICFEFLLLCRGPRKGRFSMETGRFWPICPFGARNGQICFEFLLLCCKPRKGVFKRKRAASGPSALSGPEMVKFALIALAKPSIEGPCRALHAEGYPLPERTPKMIGHEG